MSFFDESREQSQVKATIVAKYFWAWAINDIRGQVNPTCVNSSASRVGIPPVAGIEIPPAKRHAAERLFIEVGSPE
jgi:hypothetical protein